MKKIIIASFILMHLFACDKENTQPAFEYLDNIIAGKTVGLGIKYSGIINDTGSTEIAGGGERNPFILAG